MQSACVVEIYPRCLEPQDRAVHVVVLSFFWIIIVLSDLSQQLSGAAMVRVVSVHRPAASMGAQVQAGVFRKKLN